MALKDSNSASLTYGELAHRVDIIAAELLRVGVEIGSRVVIFQQPTVDWICSMFAILKIGGVCAPLDANTPLARLMLVVNDCQPSAILIHDFTEESQEGLQAPSNATVINVSALSDVPTATITIRAKADSTAIILYTSGSTGNPKGVELLHSGLKYAFDLSESSYAPVPTDVILQQSAFTFDLSIIQTFLALSFGATLCIASNSMRADSREIVDFIRKEGITVTFATPTEYKSWLRQDHWSILKGSAWRFCLMGGEAVTEPLLQLFRDLDISDLRLFNWYGPTETTCGSTGMELTYRDPEAHPSRIPAGRVFANEALYILDDKMRLQPIGLPGEIFIGGAGVSPGYLNNDKQTLTAFLPDVFASSDYIRHGWKMMYRTGDRGRLLPNGCLMLEGRIGDGTEIKLHGVRIDLRDVEQSVLRAAGGNIADAAASLRFTADRTSKFMVVHVIFSSLELLVDGDRFLENLLATLPLLRAMRPSVIIPVESFPRTVSGKLDRRAVMSLPISKRVLDPSGCLELSLREAQMRSLWEKVIPDELSCLHKIQPYSDFFHVGGNSLLLIELGAIIREQFHISISLIGLFQSSTLQCMARLLDADEPKNSIHIDWTKETEPQPELVVETPLDERSSSTRPPRVIVITGATGFLGRYLLRALIARDEVEEIISIGMRGLDNERQAIFKGMEKVVCYEGDLSLPQLGLTNETAYSIFQRAEAVIHNGADVSHLKTFSTLRSANLNSTQDLARLCLSRQIPMHYISTAGVTLYSKSESFEEVSVRGLAPPTDGLYGYLASKWASEVYLEKVHELHNLPVWIHRPSSIIRPGSKTLGNTATPDILQNMIGYSQQLHAVPIASSLQGTLDLVYPETVARIVIDDVITYEPELQNGVAYRHESGDVELPISRLKEHLELESGEKFEKISLDEWIIRARNVGLSDAMATIFQGLSKMEHLSFPRLLRGSVTASANRGPD